MKKAKTRTIHIEDDFSEVESKTIDERNRIVLGMLKKLPETRRVKVYVNSQGEYLIRPIVEIPASEAWLYKNKKALASVRRGLKQAAEGKTSKLDLKSLD